MPPATVRLNPFGHTHDTDHVSDEELERAFDRLLRASKTNPDLEPVLDRLQLESGRRARAAALERVAP